jgi:DNA-directed RNA polymerase subunit RPC12/RpoP
MPERKIRTTEYWCTRCTYKWITRRNGKESPNRPKACARCKSKLWDIPRNNDMTKFYRTQEYRLGGPDNIKKKMSERKYNAFLDKQASAKGSDQMPEEFLKDWEKIKAGIVRNISNRHKRI